MSGRQVAVVARAGDLPALVAALVAARGPGAGGGGGPGDALGEAELLACEAGTLAARAALSAADGVVLGARAETADEAEAAVSDALSQMRASRSGDGLKGLLAVAIWGPGAPALADLASHPTIVLAPPDALDEPPLALARRVSERLSLVTPAPAEARHRAVLRALSTAEPPLAPLPSPAPSSAPSPEPPPSTDELSALEGKVAALAYLVREREALAGEQARELEGRERALRQKEIEIRSLERRAADAERQAREATARARTLEQDIKARDETLSELLSLDAPAPPLAPSPRPSPPPEASGAVDLGSLIDEDDEGIFAFVASEREARLSQLRRRLAQARDETVAAPAEGRR